MNNAIGRASEALEERADFEVGSRLKEYLRENEHQGWDGFDSRDLTGVRRMLEDFVLFLENYIVDEVHHPENCLCDAHFCSGCLEKKHEGRCRQRKRGTNVRR